MPIYRRLITSAAIPWRIRHRIESWVESAAYRDYPGLYRWLHFERAANPVHPITKGPKHHFFGYYDKSPWNASGRVMLGHESEFNDRPPSAEDAVGIGVIDLNSGKSFEQLATGNAWNWQQGAMLQWHPAAMERLFVHNDCRDGQFVGVIQDVEKGERAVLGMPVYALSPDGMTGFSVNFARLAKHRPGYGYAGGRDLHAKDPHPAQDGVWQLDLVTGRYELAVSLAELAAREPKPSMHGAWHYVNHVQPSPRGKRIAFFHVWHTDGRTWEVRLYTCRPDGSELACLLDTGFISHYDWRDDDAILIWANRPNDSARFLLISLDRIGRSASGVNGVSVEVFGDKCLNEDGHCSFSPDGKWVLNDTYPDAHQKRTLMLVRASDAKRLDIIRLYSPKSRWWGEIRCDLHPRWSRDGRYICIDSVHEGTRQMYVIDVAPIG